MTQEITNSREEELTLELMAFSNVLTERYGQPVGLILIYQINGQLRFGANMPLDNVIDSLQEVLDRFELQKSVGR